MKTLMLWVLSFALVCGGCTYETVNETEAVTADDAETPPPGQDAGDDVSIWSKGASANKTLTRGSSTPTQMLSETFLENGVAPAVPDASADDGSVTASSGSPQAKAGVYTVQFSTRPLNGIVPDTVNPTITYANITWAVGGNQIQRTVSVANGVSVTGVGSGCVVSVYDATTVAPGDPIPQYEVVATLSPGSRGSSGNPPLYYPDSYLASPSATVGIGASGTLADIGTGGDNQVEVLVPPNAGAISVQVTTGTLDGSTPNVIIYQEIGIGGTIKRLYNNSTYPGFVPLDPDATAVGIENLTTGAKGANVFWGLAFGVDG